MANIFVSYDREDSDFGEVVLAKLHKAGYETLMDMEILSAGDDWRQKIDQAISSAQALLIVMTPEAAASLYVTYEWAFALGAGLTVIPLELRPTTFHPRLEILQRLDFTNKARPWEKLLSEIERSLENNILTTINVSRIAPPSIKSAVAALDGLDTQKQLLAVENLAQMDHPAAQDALLKALDHPNRNIRIAASFYYPDRKDLRILPGMFEVYRDYNMVINWFGGRGEKRESLTSTIERIGESAVPLLLDLLQTKNLEIRREAIIALQCLKDTRAINLLIDALGEPSLLAYAIDALAEIGDVAVAHHLYPFLHHEESYIRRETIQALGKLKDRNALPELLKLLREDRISVRSEAAKAVGKIGDVLALPTLLEALQDESIAMEVVDALAEFGHKEAIPELRKFLAKCDGLYIKIKIARALMLLKDNESIELSVNLLKNDSNSNFTDQQDIVLALGKMGEIAIPELADIIFNEKIADCLRECAAQSLKQIGTNKALDLVKQWERSQQ